MNLMLSAALLAATCVQPGHQTDEQSFDKISYVASLDNSHVIEITRTSNTEDPNDPIIIAIHGLLHDESAFTYLRDEVEELIGDRINSFVSMSLSGHGNSGWDCNSKYGTISLDDYVNDLESVLSSLPKETPKILVAHSMGTMIVQMAASMLPEYNVVSAVLVSPIPPDDVHWEYFGPSIVLKFASLLKFSSDSLCWGLTNDTRWQRLFLTDVNGDYPYGKPPLEDISYYNSPEPCLGALELLGLDNGHRPVIPYGALSSLDLYTIAYTDDIYVSVSDADNTYEYVSGDTCSSNTCYTISGPHDGILVNPYNTAKIVAQAVTASF